MGSFDPTVHLTEAQHGGEQMAELEPENAQDSNLKAGRRTLALGILGALGGASLLKGCAVEPSDKVEAPDAPLDVVLASLSSAGASIQWSDTYDELRALTGGNTAAAANVAVVRGSSSGAPYRNGGGIFAWDDDTTSPDDGGTVIASTAGRTGCWKRIFSGPLDVAWFGAAGNGVTDDRGAVQRAIETALAGQRANTVVLSGRHRIGSSLIVDRPVDITKNELSILGMGEGAGLIASTSINLFDSSLTAVAHPVCEFITFENVLFEASEASLEANVLSPNKFLRIKCINCNFRRIRLVQSSIYSQTFHISSCNIREWQGTFICTRGSYDISLVNNIVENGGTNASLLRSVDPSNTVGTFGLRVIGNLIEGIPGIVLALGGCMGCTIHGNYFERHDGTTNPHIHLLQNEMPHLGLSISGNFFTTTPGVFQFAIEWGPGVAFSSGNWCEGKLHNKVPPGDQLKLNSINDGQSFFYLGVGGDRHGFFPPDQMGVAQNNTGVVSGVGEPNNYLGKVGDFYLRSDTPGELNQRIYVKVAPLLWQGIV